MVLEGQSMLPELALPSPAMCSAVDYRNQAS